MSIGNMSFVLGCEALDVKPKKMWVVGIHPISLLGLTSKNAQTRVPWCVILFDWGQFLGGANYTRLCI